MDLRVTRQKVTGERMGGGFPLIIDGPDSPLHCYVIPSVAEESKSPVRSQGRAFQIPRLRSE